MSSDAADAPARGRLARWIPPLLLAALFCGLAAMSWRRWPDVLVDFGTQLYVPWRLSEGAVLYRDIRCLYGPLSMYANAALFSVFGASFQVLFLADLAVLVLIAVLLHRHLAGTFDRLTAFTGGAAFLSAFAFAQYVGIGNYNYASPYSHEATHGMALSLAAMHAAGRFERTRRTGWLAAAGLAFGATCLARAEIAVAAAAYVAVRLLVVLPGTGVRGPQVGRWLAAFAGAAVLPFAVCLLAFARALPAGDAARAAGGAWTSLLGSNIASDPFFVEAMGFDRPWENVGDVLSAAAAAVVAAAIALAAARGAANPARSWPVRVLAALVLPAVVASAFWVDIVALARPFPALVLAGLALAAWALVRTPWGRARRPALGAALAFGCFALALLAKMLLNCRIAHYGFYLAMPAAVFLCATLVWLVPHLGATPPRARTAFRWAVLAVVLVLGGRYVHHSWTYFVRKVFPIGAGADRIVSFARDGRAMPITQTLAWIERTMPPDATFTVMPEGIMLNFLTRRRSPVSYTTFMTIDFQAWPESVAAAELAARPPDYVVLVHRDTREFRVGWFGRDDRYGRRIMDWVTANYRPVARFGAEPFVADRFGIKILERLDRAP